MEDTDRLDENFLAKAEPLLSEQRIQKIREYAVPSDKINAAAVYLLLRYGLKTEYQMTEKPVFDFISRGKPCLSPAESGIYFNLSHCGNAAVCIISDENTAIDVMELRKVRSSVIRRTCSMEERQQLSMSNEPERDFIKLWTRKECYAKLDGRGLLLDFSGISQALPAMHNIHTIDFGKYILSYYSKGTMEIAKVNTALLL